MSLSSLHRGGWIVATSALLAGCATGADLVAPVLPGVPVVREQEVGVADWPDPVDPNLTETLTQVAAEAVTDYLLLTDAITSQGGEGASAMAALTTDTWFTSEQRGFERYRQEGFRTVGQTVFDSLVIQSFWELGTGGVELDVVACIDATGVWLLPVEAPDPPEGLMEWIRSDTAVFDGEEEQWETWSEYLDTYQPQPGLVEPVVVWLVGSDVTTLRIDGTANWEGGHSCALDQD